MSSELLDALELLEKEKGIDKEIFISAIEEALITAYGTGPDATKTPKENEVNNKEVKFDRETGEIKLYINKTVVEEVTDPGSEISLAEAREIDPEFELGEVAQFEETPADFGRLASQKAKHIITQKIREKERDLIYDQYSAKAKEIISGTVQRYETRSDGEKTIYIDLGKTEGILLPQEQVKSENYRFGERIKTYVLKVDKTPKDPKIFLSRTHPDLVRRLFELEVPEIHDGVVEIKSIAREPGSRTKIAVDTNDEAVEAVGACVGQKGNRVQNIVDELKGERIDVIKWSEDSAELIGNSLSPAKVVSIEVDEEEKSAKVIVPDQQLSLAIGKEGQNVRLAAKLTGWKIDIKSESDSHGDMELDLFNDVAEDSAASAASALFAAADEIAAESVEENAEENTEENAAE